MLIFMIMLFAIPLPWTAIGPPQGLSDEAGASADVGYATKQRFPPVQSEIEALDLYINSTLWGIHCPAAPAAYRKNCSLQDHWTLRHLGLAVLDHRFGDLLFLGDFLMRLYRALRGCSCGSRGFLEDRMMDTITGRAPPPARAESHLFKGALRAACCVLKTYSG